ncbi:hypothetical protein BX616_008916 [Lobosporangium transversale]|uniref:Large-conductance mechanosensitive channel n=1 Tax=Lobosporangium transversale TaxID=64571 RepID=A0A1Y2H314_9FUNG|nr:large-conductance mechanosensitive channel [Lobosporangium transversale]KAF9914123.1 hypothetical protein BX616_008916 [Lobosporangium transversale]ORZ28936.1 large-conductance mechanosensitive channel [Lobosporangium transversale]|eukprot:XP_021886609.1 large-conductance mechanosensitive channel [Lobosporangium transversale]
MSCNSEKNTIVNIDTVPSSVEIDEDSAVNNNNNGERKEHGTKRRISLNPAKVVIQGANVVKGGISQMENNLNEVGGKLTKVPGVSQGVSIFADYRKFLDRGNVIDLAVAVVIGAAFTGIVDSLVKDIIAPILALASGRALEENFVILRRNDSFPNPDYSTRASVKASDALSWNYGNFIQTVINFFIISACVFVIVKLYQMGRNTKVAVTEKKCPFCAGSIDFKAVRCSKCTSWLDDTYARSEVLYTRVLEKRSSSSSKSNEKEEW